MSTAYVRHCAQPDNDVAAASLERSPAENPKEPHTLAELGMVRFFETDKLEPNIALIGEAEAATPHHPLYNIWAYRRGICCYEAGDLPCAIAACADAIARAPGYHHTYLTTLVAQLSDGADETASQSIR